MTSLSYMQGRKKWGRPQAALWSDNSGTLVTATAEDVAKYSNLTVGAKFYVPNGYEIGANPGSGEESELDQFLILSDHNRKPIGVNPVRIEKRERMINGRMRSYHIADKLNFSMSWDLLPSRSFSENPDFDSDGNTVYTRSGSSLGQDQQYTVDGGAGGVDLLNWYETHQGSFWMYLAYDKYSNFDKNNEPRKHLHQYNQLVEVYFGNFDYSIIKRGSNNFDYWNINLTLEEV